MRKCAACGKKIPRKKNLRYCEECREERKRRRYCSWRKTRHKEALRKCLRCGEMFLSEGPWNRICATCSEAKDNLPKWASLPPRIYPKEPSDEMY